MSNLVDYYRDNPRFRCCCQFCHVRTGTKAVAIGSIILASYFLIKSFAFLGRNVEDYRAATVLTLIISSIWLAASIVLLIAVIKEMPRLVLPFLCIQVPIIVVSATLGVLCVTYLAIGRAPLLAATGATDREPRTLRGHEDHMRLLILVGVQALVYGLAFAFGIWFFITALQCYRYLKEKKENSDGQGFTMDMIRAPSRV